MGFKDNKIWVRFFGTKQGQANVKPAPASLIQEKQAAQPPPPVVFEDELRLPPEHALNKLYDIRARRAGSISHPRLRLEGREDFTQAEMKQELGRLQSAVTVAADSRLKEVVSRAEAASARAEGQQEQPMEPARLSEERDVPSIGMDALPFIYIAADRLSAWMMVFPPVGEGKELNREHLEDALKEKGVSFGVDQELLKNLPEDQERYFSLFFVARGRPAHQGKDGYIIERYDRVVERKFAVDEHDRVDYTSLHFFQNVEKGDVICEAVQPTMGEPGRTVLDQEIPVKNVKAVSLTGGNNTEISADGTQLLASRAGHVEYSGKNFQVKTVLDIAENVDYSTGNIKYLGDVHIHGSVRNGFKVQASGNVTVDGVVEAGSIDAGGDLIVARGIVGNARCMVQARHNVYAKYLENCVVHARDNLKADSIVNSDVYSDGEIQVCSGRGIIVGGRIRAAKKVTARVVGSRSESPTFIFLGGEPCIEFERQELAELVKEYQTELDKLEKRPDSPGRTEHMNHVRLELLVNKVKLQRMDEEMADKQLETQNQDSGRLVCDIAYPGLVLTISDEKVRLQQEISKCNARLVEGELKLL